MWDACGEEWGPTSFLLGNLVQGLSGLTLSLGANGPGLLREGELQQHDAEEKLQRERQQESKRMVQRLLKQWLKEN